MDLADPPVTFRCVYTHGCTTDTLIYDQSSLPLIRVFFDVTTSQIAPQRCQLINKSSINNLSHAPTVSHARSQWPISAITKFSITLFVLFVYAIVNLNSQFPRAHCRVLTHCVWSESIFVWRLVSRICYVPILGTYDTSATMAWYTPTPIES